MTESVYKERRKKLTAALRSGQYKQIQGTLKREDGMCCLGVACELSGLGSWEEAHDGEHEYFTKEVKHQDDPYSTHRSASNSILPTKVQNYYGFTSENGKFDQATKYGKKCLSELNDRGYTFTQLADIIDMEPEGLIANGKG